MRRLIPLITVCLLLSAAAEPLFAQQRLFARMEQEIVELDPRSASLGTVIRRFPLPEEANLHPSSVPRITKVVPFGGGELLAWVGQGVVLLNTRSGAVQRFTFPNFFPTRVIGTNGTSRLLILGTNLSQHDVVLVADARSASTHFLDLGSALEVRPIAYAAAADVVFAARARTTANPFLGSDFYDVDVIEASTGTVIKTLDISPVSADALSTNAAGTRLFATDLVDGTFVFDVVSGTQLASNTSSSLTSPGLFDEHRNRMLVGTGGIEAFSADSLQFLGSASVPLLPMPPPQQTSGGRRTGDLDVSGLSATIFLLDGVHAFDYPCKSQLIALDADTGRVRRTVGTTDTLGDGACVADLVRITEPGPPPGLAAHVTGRRVTLTWPTTIDASRYEVEAGSAAGLTNLATVDVAETHLTVDNIPPGIYYLRVRAINTIGKSAPSQEIRVVVQ